MDLLTGKAVTDKDDSTIRAVGHATTAGRRSSQLKLNEFGGDRLVTRNRFRRHLAHTRGVASDQRSSGGGYRNQMSASKSVDQERSVWLRDGWCVLPDLMVNPVRAAQQATASLFPSASEMEHPSDPAHEAWRTWDASWPIFPFEELALNNLVTDPALIDLARNFLQTNDVRLYQAMVTAKYFDQPSDYNRLLHTDYPNHSLVVPRTDSGYQHLELFIYLNDVTENNGATRIVSRTLTSSIPVERHTLSLTEYADLYGNDVAAVGQAGAVLAYRSDVYHRSVDITEPGQARFLAHVAFKPAGAEWIGHHDWPSKGFAMPWHAFVNQASPLQLEVLGFPKPGHPYWNEQTLDGVSARYPGLDMTPWRR